MGGLNESTRCAKGVATGVTTVDQNWAKKLNQFFEQVLPSPTALLLHTSVSSAPPAASAASHLTPIHHLQFGPI